MFDFLKNRPRYVDVEEGGAAGRKNKILIITILLAIAVFAFGNAGVKGDAKDREASELEQGVEIEDYIRENERRLEEILSAVQGAGRVKAMITVTELAEKVVATDEKSETKQQTEKETTERDIARETTTVIYGTGNEEKPFVVKERLPMPSGVVVAATGAGDENVRLELYEAVKALYGLSGHRIKITKGNIK